MTITIIIECFHVSKCWISLSGWIAMLYDSMRLWKTQKTTKSFEIKETICVSIFSAYKNQQTKIWQNSPKPLAEHRRRKWIRQIEPRHHQIASLSFVHFVWQYGKKTFCSNYIFSLFHSKISHSTPEIRTNKNVARFLL